MVFIDVCCVIQYLTNQLWYRSQQFNLAYERGLDKRHFFHVFLIKIVYENIAPNRTGYVLTTNYLCVPTSAPEFHTVQRRLAGTVAARRAGAGSICL